MLELFIGEKGGVAKSATAPIRWCIGPETQKKLAKHDVKNPHLLLVVVADNKEMTRQLAPLTDVMDYIQFQKPGPNKVYATIVWNRDGKRGELEKRFTQIDGGRYRTHVIGPDGNFWFIDDSYYRERNDDSYPYPFSSYWSYCGYAEISVNVPQELFAKEYPNWLKRWTNWGYKFVEKYVGPCRDQCQFRKRALFSPLVNLFALCLVMGICAIRFFEVVLLLSCGIRRVNFKPVFHPFTMRTDDIINDIKYIHGWHSVFLRTWTIAGRKHTTFYLLPFTPIVLLCLSALIYLGAFSGIMLAAKMILMAVVAIIVFQSVITAMGVRIVNRVAERDAQRRYQYLDDPWLACNKKEGASADVGVLPEKKKTLFLRYKGLKASICKPLAK